jgi:hypothetical protein
MHYNADADLEYKSSFLVSFPVNREKSSVQHYAHTSQYGNVFIWTITKPQV